MKKLILAATMAIAAPAVLAGTADAQVGSTQPVPSVRLAPLSKEPSPARRPILPNLSLQSRALDTSAIWLQPPVTRHVGQPWLDREPNPWKRWPFRADPRRWPGLFANTTECSLSFDPILRRHWFD